jgi:muramidase (phage lysozyme)
MDGISGIKIGQAFRINDAIMPAKYNGVVGFIVTGVDHAITGNRWTTTLKAQTMVLQGKLKTNSTLTSSQNNQGFSTNKKRGIRTAAPTSAKKLASFGKVSDSVPIHAKPILDTIAYTEGTAAVGNNGYDILVGFEQLPGWTEDYKLGHPNKVVKLSRTLASSAAGRYQFLTSTWKGLKLSSFNKSNQDLGGWNLVQKQTAVKNSFEVAKEQISSNKIDVNKNLGFLTFLDGNYAVWASLVNRNGEARYGGQGGVFDPADIYKVYIEAVKKYT